MFNLNVKPGGKSKIYEPLSVAVKYINDDKSIDRQLNDIKNEFSVKLSRLQVENLKSEKGSDIWINNPDSKPDMILLSKYKINEKFTADHFRNHLAGVIQKLNDQKVKHLHIFIPVYKNVKPYFDREEYFYQSFIEGLYLGNYSFDKYKKDKNAPVNLNVYFYSGNIKYLNNAFTKSAAIAEGINFTKDLQNEPSSSLRPFELAQNVKSTLTKAGLKVTVFDEKELKKRNMGGLLAVGKGSSSKPRMIIVHYKPSSPGKKLRKVALVGKGVTFDSGGLCVKPAQGMLEMKADMSGAAVVAGIMLAAAKAKLPLEILGVIPSAENMINGEAMRPGDVVMTASGKTIEVGHTDAEGRMILADALDYASKQNPDEIIDFATLTGACVVALGLNVAGLFTKNDKLADKLFNSGMKTYDRLWRLPMWDDYHKANESKIADVNNEGGRWAGAITAAKFLENFVNEKIPWAHLDIAGPAIANDAKNYTKDYMTGFGVRLMFDYLSGK